SCRERQYLGPRRKRRHAAWPRVGDDTQPRYQRQQDNARRWFTGDIRLAHHGPHSGDEVLLPRLRDQQPGHNLRFGLLVVLRSPRHGAVTGQLAGGGNAPSLRRDGRQRVLDSRATGLMPKEKWTLDLPGTPILDTLFDAHTVLIAISDDTPVALVVDEQTVVGRLTGENITAVTIGISDNNMVQIDHASATDNDYAKFTAAGLEGRSFAEVLTDLAPTAADISIATGSGSPTVDQVQEYLDNTGSSGYFTGGILSDGGSGTIDVTAGEGFIRTTADDNAPLLSFKWNASTGIAVLDNTTQYVFVDDDGVISLNPNEFLEAQDKILLGVVTDEGGVISHTFNLGVRLEESIGQMGRYIRRVDSVVRDRRKGGLIFGQSGDANRDVTVTAGSLWWGRTEYAIPAFDTSGADTFDTYSAGGQEATGASQWPNAQYDNAGTLTTMINNRWAVLWFYIEPDGHIVMLYGRNQYVT
ncbi:hypothetical protein LCGC14_2581000, partial [marine sediment metagenome]